MEENARRDISLAANQFRVLVDEIPHFVELTDQKSALIDKRTLHFEFIHYGFNRYLLLLENRVFEIYADIAASNGIENILTLSVNGRTYEVVVEDHRALIKRELLQDYSGATRPQLIKAPMPGKVVKVEVAEGEVVKPGTGLLVLEAMKMENEIRSTSSGVVDQIHAQQGRAVEKGELLMSIKPQ
jgi:biotin carboxyl carrier protein